MTIHGVTYELPNPFFVMATQNPVEYEGTYVLPEAQLDRFLFKLQVDYPSQEQELEILKQHVPFFAEKKESETVVCGIEEIVLQRQKLEDVVVEEQILAYITTIIRKTRETKRLLLGASSRAGIAVLMASKAWALLDNRMYVTPDDVKAVARPALRHRLIVAPQVELEGETVTTSSTKRSRPFRSLVNRLLENGVLPTKRMIILLGCGAAVAAAGSLAGLGYALFGCTTLCCCWRASPTGIRCPEQRRSQRFAGCLSRPTSARN